MWLSSRPFLWQPSCFSFWSGLPFNTVASCPWTIATVFAEARYSFERLRERSSYSEAKTGIDYLPLRLCTLDLKAAAAFVQRAHVRKLEAELYPELKFHLKKRGINKTLDQWGDGIYFQLFDVRELLEAHAGEWDSLGPDARLALLREVLKAPVRSHWWPARWVKHENMLCLHA
jgi:hypothetical protein